MKFRILVLLSVLLPFLVSAEEKQSAFRSLNADDGLTHNAVLAILQDRMGFMWFGTKDGLNRYDGTEIRIIAVEDAIPGNNYITTLCEDGDGCIWMGTDAGVCIYDPGTSHRNNRKTKEFIFLIISYLHISYFLHFCPILPVFCYSVHF